MKKQKRTPQFRIECIPHMYGFWRCDKRSAVYQRMLNKSLANLGMDDMATLITNAMAVEEAKEYLDHNRVKAIIEVVQKSSQSRWEINLHLQS